MSTETETRQQLAAAIAARDDATDKVTGHLAALARATALVSELESEVHKSNAHAAASAAQTAAALADQLLQGAELAIASPSKTSAEVREAAATRLSVATTARDQLQRETNALQQSLTQAEGVVRTHALALIRIEAERIAMSVEQHESELFDLRTKLRGVELAAYALAGTAGGTWQRPNLLTPRAVSAMVRPEEPQLVGGHDPAKDCAGQWKQFYDALIEDAQVRFFS